MPYKDPENRRAYNERNKEKIRAYMVAYNERNKEKKRGYLAAYNQRNREKIRAQQRSYNARNKERLRAYRLYREYNLSLEQFKDLVTTQSGRCASCKELFQSNKRTHVDHCHKTGRVRSILCSGCNTELGQLKECPVRIRALAYYAETVFRDS